MTSSAANVGGVHSSAHPVIEAAISSLVVVIFIRISVCFREEAFVRIGVQICGVKRCETTSDNLQRRSTTVTL